ncbi:MAG TPA: hypothetical protein ENI81_13580 [Phycisphaerales bacterium]|nr:hypothetical protein [Phycisphaerales bacterium]
MKRISFSVIVLLLVAAGAAEARTVYGYGYGYGANRYRVRWSMHSGGLISGDIYYSPYAQGHGRSGLVDGHVRYSPYAFGGGRSGLVVDDGGSYGYCFRPTCYRVSRRPVAVVCDAQLSGTSRSYSRSSRIQRQKDRSKTIEDRKAARAALAKARKQKNATGANDGKEIIAGYLKGRNIDFKTTRILSIAGRTVSVDFLLNDGKTILKYWDPEAIPSEGQQQQRQRKFFENYLQSWKVSCAEHLQAGGNVHQIVSSDRDEILAKLPLCPDLNGVEKVYAMATTHAAP